MSPEQKKLLSLFEEINDICNRHGIVYYMAGGTLIGAIRHKGFIPWDDDMDILMTRDNWEKFIEVTRTDMPENRVLECQELDRDYPNMFGRYTDITSTAIHNNQVLGDGICGYVVDILVLDPIPDKEHHKKYTEDLMLYSDLVNPSLNYSYRFNVNQDRFLKYYKRMQHEGKDAVLSELEAGMFRYNEDECDYYVMRWGGAPFLFDKDMYGSSRWGIFEGVRCRIPDRTADYLTWHYGDDWMYIPPHNEHESHDAIFSFTTQYKTIQNDYMRYINVPKVRKSMIKRKMFFFKHMKSRLEMKDREVRAIATATEMDTIKAVADCGFDIRAALEDRQYGRLNELYGDFYNKQLSRKVIGREDYTGINRFNNPAYCDIGDDLLYPAVMVLIHTNRIAKAARLLDVRELAKGELSPDLAAARELIKAIRKAVSDDDLGQKDSSFRQIKALYEKYPDNDSLNMFYINQLLERKLYTEAESLAERALKIYPANGVYMKYLGDCMFDKDRWAALETYGMASDNTTNGVVLLEMTERVQSLKAELVPEIWEKRDLERAELILKIAPEDVELVKLKYDILVDQTDGAEELNAIIGEIKAELLRFDNDETIQALLCSAYEKTGDPEDTSKLRVKLVMAMTIDEYHEIKNKATDICGSSPDAHSFRLLGDVNTCLGLTREAAECFNKAEQMEVSDHE